MSRRVQLPQGTDFGTPAHTLKMAALASVKLTSDPQSGKRPNDPLDALVTHANAEEWAPVAGEISGRHISADWQGEVYAARVRSAMRRWAVAL